MWWDQRRPEIVEDFDREIYGRVPDNIPKVTWEVVSITNDTSNHVAAITKKLIGHVDNSSWYFLYSSVNIDLALSTPANAKGPVPVIMEFLVLFFLRGLNFRLLRQERQFNQDGSNSFLKKAGDMQL